MPNRRLLAMLSLLAHDESAVQHPLSLCSAAAMFTLLNGAGILLSSLGPHYTTFCASDETTRLLLETEITLGEGPGRAACESAQAIDVVDLTNVVRRRWIGYTQAAQSVGASAVFAFPVTLGTIGIGALVLYRDQPGPLSEQQESDGYLAASVVGRAILNWRAGASGAELTSELGMTLSFDFSVHQAAGMVAVQANLGLGDAMVMLRAHAIGSGITMTELSKSVVGREIGYDATTRSWHDLDAPTI